MQEALVVTLALEIYAKSVEFKDQYEEAEGGYSAQPKNWT